MSDLVDIKGYALAGVVIGQASLVEELIDDILADFYSGGSGKISFRDDLLLGDLLSLSDKYKLLKKIAKRKGVATTKLDNKNFYKWKEIRNIVAHSKPGIDKDTNRYAVECSGELYFLDDLVRKFGVYQDSLREYLDKF
jgi:hypothetical protein